MNIGKRLKAERARLSETMGGGLTQSALAKMLQARDVTGPQGKELTFGAIGHWENDRETPSVAALVALAAIYGRTVSFLLGEWDEDLEDLIQQALRVARKR